MSLTITEPIKTVNGLLTYALAADSQLLYTFQRVEALPLPTNYRIEIQVLDHLSAVMFGQTIRYLPNQSGFLDIDVGNFVVEYIKAFGDQFSELYQLSVTEVWDGSSEAPVLTTQLQAIVAQKQNLSIGGANMWEYLMDSVSLGRFLTVFKNPVAWRGWNRTATILIDQQATARTGETIWDFREGTADVNKVNTGSLPLTPYSVTPARVQTTLLTETDEYYSHIKVEGSNSGDQISEQLYFEWRNECPNPIMLDWINSKGGIDQWLFTQNQLVTLEQDAGIVAEAPITTDIEFITQTKRRYSRNFVQRVTLQAKHLTKDQILALEEIKQTESLRVYLNYDGTKWVDAIIVQDFTTSGETKNVLFSFSCTIEFPNNFKFGDAWLQT